MIKFGTFSHWGYMNVQLATCLEYFSVKKGIQHSESESETYSWLRLTLVNFRKIHGETSSIQSKQWIIHWMRIKRLINHNLQFN